ncbi:MAG: O-antigen ligase family protein [Eubacteriales bacterium]|jgi:O-antigen ligase|nr:O-antigen ligase family protein [Eubacteriales bacterium]
MTKVIRSSKIFALGLWIKKKWRKSLIGCMVTQKTNDIKIKSSGTYRLFIYFLGLLSSGFESAGKVLGSLIENSTIVSFFHRLLIWTGQAFKNSLLCQLLEKVLDFEFNFTGLKVHQFLVFLVVFLAPIVPTMVNAALIVLAIGFYLISCIREGYLSVRLEAVGFLVLSLVLIFGFYAVTSLAPQSSIKIWLIYSFFMLSFFLVLNTVNSMDRLYKMAAIFVSSGLLVSLYGILQRFFGSNEGHAWIDDDMFSQTLRVYSTLENPNVLGEYLLLAIPICAAVFWTRKALLPKLFYGGTLGAMLICMILTMSRGCWLGLILVAAVFAAFTDWRLVLAGLVLVFLMPFVVPQSIIARFSSIGNISDTSTSYRLYIWLGTINMLKHFGLYGIGLGGEAFNKIYPFYAYSAAHALHSHSIYLQLLSETGIVGLGTVIITVIFAFKKMLLTRIQYKKAFPGIFAISILAGILGFMLQGFFDYTWYNYRVFLIFWMVMAMGIAPRRVKHDKTTSRNN